MKSIRWKLVIMYIALVFIVMIISGTFMTVTLRRGEEDKAEYELKQATGKIVQTIIEPNNPEFFQAAFSDMTEIGAGRIYSSIIDAGTRKVIATNVTSDEERFPVYSSKTIIQALAGGRSFAAGRNYNDDITGAVKPWMEYAQPYLVNGKVTYVIYSRSDATNIYENIGKTTRTLALSTVLALVLTAVLGFLFANSLTTPIAALTNKARELARGKLHSEIPVASRDEIGQLTMSFNNMAKELNKTMSGMENEKNKQEILLSNMTDGVLAYDNSGKLIHASRVCGELLGFPDMYGLSFTQMTGRLGVDIDLETAEPMKDITINIGKRFLDASFNTYKNKTGALEGIVIVLHDITEHIRLDNMRKEFVANVSHEIRTPLTAIKGYAETLINGSIDDREVALEFLEVINSETDRMTLIVKDLLELSRFDGGQMTFSFTEVNLTELIRRNIKQHRITAANGGKSVNFEPEREDVTVTADPERISQVLTNIISNALKYSPEGSSVDIVLEETKEHYCIVIRDNGFGIPKGDLPHIFERFYRVDKARSRDMGGTGLGLSIAKEIIEAHGGKIWASSQPGKGTAMTVMLRK